MSEKHGISETGFRIKSFDEIRNSVREKMRKIIDPKTGDSFNLDFDENDPLVNVIDILLEENAILWEMAYAVYGQFNPQNCTGASLSGLVMLNGIQRKKGSPSTVLLLFTGEPGTTIPAGFRVSDETLSKIWITSSEATIEQNGQVRVFAQSVENGVFAVEAGEICRMLDTLRGLKTVVNLSEARPGTKNESDIDLRIRRSKSTESPSMGLAESIYGSIANLDGVRFVRVYNNRKMEEDENGVPPKSVCVVVDGGKDQEIARELFNRSSFCEDFYGNTVVRYTDSLNQSTDVCFMRPDPVPIYVDIIVSRIEGSAIPRDYRERIAENILAFAVTGPDALCVSDEKHFDDFGFPPGEDVVMSRLYLPVGAVPGIKIVDMKISKDGENFSQEDIKILWKEVAEFSASRITVTEV